MGRCRFRFADGRGARCPNDAKAGGEYCADHDTRAKRIANDPAKP